MSDAAVRLFDTHAHLDLEQFDDDRQEVIRRARSAGVEAVLTVGISASSSLAAAELARQDDLLFAAVGIHPVDCGEALPQDWDTVMHLLDRPRVVALGETGLDNHWKRTSLAVQQDYFDRHLRLAQQRDLPIIIHQRESQAEILVMLREARQRGPLRGIMHSFTATEEDAAECLELGLHISFAGMVTFKKSDELRRVATTIPSDRILVETDSPFLSPQPHRGKRNEPARVIHTASCLAESREEPLAVFAEKTTNNARRLFRLDEAS